MDGINIKTQDVKKVEIKSDIEPLDINKNKNSFNNEIDTKQKEVEIIQKGGKLLVTRYNIIYIYNGKVKWQEDLVHMPLKKAPYTYVASNKYVFCSLDNGKIIWIRKLKNNGKVQFSDNGLFVFTPNGKKNLNLENGKDLL